MKEKLKKLKKLEELMDESIMIAGSLVDDFMKEGDVVKANILSVFMMNFNSSKVILENMKLEKVEETGEKENEK